MRYRFGAGLALAGAVLQSVLRIRSHPHRPWGFPRGAAFGATLALLVVAPVVAGASTGIGMGAVALFAFAGALASSAVVLLFSRLGLQPGSIVLVGVALSALWAGASTIIQYFRTILP